MNEFHISVLLEQTIELLKIQPGKKYIDATLGGGGHTQRILEHGGIVLGIDADQDALEYVKENLLIKNEKSKFNKENLKLVKGNFKDIDRIAWAGGFEKVSGILFDLGVSSHQFDRVERGFSFQKEGPLDMRMDRDLNVKAGDLVNILTKGELYELFYKLGEERFARAIAERITRARRISPIQTTTDLADVINQAVPRYQKNINPATRIFQALRIAINDELNNLRDALPKAVNLLEQDGRLAVISFHSLEDRIVKNQFKDWKTEGIGIPETVKPIIPDVEEQGQNRRSRSAKLRVFKKGGP